MGLSLHTPPGFSSSSPAPAHAPSVCWAGGVKSISAGQVPHPQTGCRPRRAAVPARGESQGLSWPPSCCPDGSRCAWGSLAFHCLPLTSVVCHGGKPTLGRAPGRRGSLKCSPPRHTAASEPPPVCAQGQDCLVDSCHREAEAVTCSMTDPRNGLCCGESPSTLTPLWGSQESWNTLVPLPPQSLNLWSPHPSVTITLHGLGPGWHQGASAAPSAHPGHGDPCGGSKMVTTSARRVICICSASSCTRHCAKLI